MARGTGSDMAGAEASRGVKYDADDDNDDEGVASGERALCCRERGREKFSTERDLLFVG